MRKLLSANFARLGKSKVFWTMESVCLLTGVIFYFLFIINTRNIGESWLLHSANYYFFLFIIYVGIIMGIFTSVFIGTEYSDGTIRNKLSVGHCRRNIYLANLLVVCAAGLLFCIPHIGAAFLMGIPLAGSGAVAALSAPVWRLGCCVLIVGVYAVVFGLIAMVDSNKTRSAIISMVLAFILVLGGMYVYGSLQEPEFTSRMVMLEDGRFELQENIPNSKYVRGMVRTVFEWVDVSLPSSVAFHITARDGEFDWRMPLCLGGLSVLLSVVGINYFQKKDIR